MNIFLANSSYSGHTTDEGNQLQLALQHAGFLLVGSGYGDGMRDVPQLIERHQPKVIVIADPRDWFRSSGGSFGRKDLHFERHEVLAKHPEIFKCVVMKDAGTAVDFQRDFAASIKANALITYYHDKAVLPLSPWAAAYKRIRIHHSVDADLIRTIDLKGNRRRSVVTGAVSGVYPLRRMVFENAYGMGVDKIKHPGYQANYCHTPDYLRMLSQYKTHVATCSSYNFALRKIIESVAVGCVPITNLPEWDCLPEIDGALVRIKSDSSPVDVKEAINVAEENYNLDERLAWAEKAQSYYDWHTCGQRLALDIQGVMNAV